MASDNEPRLSETAMQALQEFLQEQMLQQQQEESCSVSNTTEVKFQEDWVCLHVASPVNFFVISFALFNSN